VKAASQVRAPVLILYSADDTVVPPSQSQDMARALKEHGKTVQVVELKGDDHWLSYTETRTQMLQELDAFLAAQLHN
jgi:dipeptidyl aminopeptidase/acylaminoacyl peptidase